MTGVLVPDVLAAEVLRNLAAGATARHDRTGELPSPELVALWRDLLEARDRARCGSSASGTVPVQPSTLEGGMKLSTADVAEILGCSAAYARRLARSGRLPATRTGRDWLTDPSSLDAYRYGSTA